MEHELSQRRNSDDPDDDEAPIAVEVSAIPNWEQNQIWLENFEHFFDRNIDWEELNELIEADIRPC